MVADSSKVLVVDDDPTALINLAVLLKEHGFQVTTTELVKEALQLVRAERYAVVISDQQMPGLTGLEFLQEVRRVQPLASRILVTGVRSLEIVVEAINKGEIFRFVAKPWLRAEMLATVKNAVQRYELTHENARLQGETSKLNQELAEANTLLAEQVTQLKQQQAELQSAGVALRSNLDRSLELCQRILSTFDPVLGQETRIAVALCEQMAASNHFSAEEKHTLVVSAALRDIGLTGLPHKAIRHQRGGLHCLPEELQRMVQDHPIYGQTLASFVDSLRSVGDTIRGHHECFNGSGYPDGLAGEAIPWTARCLAVADFYAGSSTPHEATVERMLQQAGVWFDPEAVRLFLRSTRQSACPRALREVTVAELQPGMELAKGLYTPSGLLLIPEGLLLDEAMIAKIRKHNAQASLTQQLYIIA